MPVPQVICEACRKAEAVAHLTVVEAGVTKTETHLCAPCLNDRMKIEAPDLEA